MAQRAPGRHERRRITLAQLFDAEFAGRHNVRSLDTAGQMAAVVRDRTESGSGTWTWWRATRHSSRSLAIAAGRVDASAVLAQRASTVDRTGCAASVEVTCQCRFCPCLSAQLLSRSCLTPLTDSIQLQAGATPLAHRGNAVQNHMILISPGSSINDLRHFPYPYERR